MFSIFSTLLVMPAAKRFDYIPGQLLILWLLIMFLLLFSLGLRKFKWISDFLLYLSPAVVIIPALFLANPQMQKILNAEVPLAKTIRPKIQAPVIMVIFDEFPLVSLLNKNLEIDSHLFPNFRKLSEKATFYRNATTAADSTTFSVPAILTGRYPRPGTLPIREDFPNTLFTLLKNSYSMKATEFATQLFPDDLKKERESSHIRSILTDLFILYGHIVLPLDLSAKIPSMSQNWGNFLAGGHSIVNPDHRSGRQKTFEDFLNSLGTQKKPFLLYLHILLPHRIWEYLPSGCLYDPFEIEQITLAQTFYWENEAVIKESYQRCLLQTQYLDGLIKRLLDRLEQESLFEQSLIIFVADHGLGFSDGEKIRELSGKNYVEMMWIPLFIKYPHQENGMTLDWNVETIDILPTIASVLDFEVPWKLDGYSLMNGQPSRTKKKIVIRSGRKEEIYQPDLKQIQQSVQRKIDWFGEEETSDLYRAGPDPWIIGKQVLNPASEFPGIKVQINKAERFTNVDPDSGFVPALLTGTLQSETLGDKKREIAIAMNGRICTTGYTRPMKKKGRHIFRVMIPESAFIKGSNNVQILLRNPQGEYLQLMPSY